MRRAATAVSLVAALAVSVRAQETQPAVPRDIGIDQRLNEQAPLDLTFRDEAGRAVQLAHYFDGKPVILALVYYECPMLCPLVLDGLVKSLKVLSFNAGDQFAVVAVSFDPGETPALAAARKELLMRQYARPGSADGWHFLTGDEAAITRLAQAVGFRYAYDAGQDQYAHAGGIVVLTPRGTVARYFYGIEFAPKDVRLGLVEAAANTIGSVVDQVLLLCYHYDPVTGKYSAAVMNLVRLGGAMTVLALGAFVVMTGRRERTKKEK